MNVQLILSYEAQGKIRDHILKEPTLECGGYLIGTIENQPEDKLVGRIDDIYVIEGSGTSANFTFTSASGLQAYAYCKKRYSSDENNKKKIIGNYHSHGNFHAFFSSTDAKMMKMSTSREFYLVFSPSHHSFTAIFKDSDAKKYKVTCDDAPGFKYIPPQMESEKERQIATPANITPPVAMIPPDEEKPVFFINKEKETTSNSIRTPNKQDGVENYGSFASDTDTAGTNNEIPKNKLVQMAGVYFLKGKEEFDNRKYPDAILSLTEAIGYNPENLTYYLLRGKAYYKNRDYENAKKDFNIIVSAQISNPKELSEAYFFLADIEFAGGLSPIVISYLTNAIEKDPQNPKYYYTRGFAYGKSKQYIKAIDDFNNVLNYQKKDRNMIIKTIVYLGMVSYHLKKYDDAKKYFEKCLGFPDLDEEAKNTVKAYMKLIDNEIKQKEIELLEPK